MAKITLTRARGRAHFVPALLILVLALAGCRASQGQVPADVGWQAVHSPVVLTALPDAGAEPLLAAIDGAKESIRLKTYLVTNQQVLDALKRAQGRGVDCRVLIEEEPYGGGDSNHLAMDVLQEAGVAVRTAPSTFRYSHEKSLVVDGQRAYIMTHNLTHSSFESNREYMVAVDDPALIEEVAQVFDADWDRVEPSLDQARLVWSPHNSRRHIEALIDGAQVSLDLEQASMLDDGVVDGLIAAAERGVRVRLITSSVLGPAEPEYEVLTRLHEAGVAVSFLDDPYVHAKVIVADGSLALVGSQNMTSVSLDLNRELGIIFDDAAAVNRLAGFMLADWNRAQPWTGPQALPTVPASGIVTWQEAPRYAGQVVTVEGIVIDTYNAGSIAFLNFSHDRDDFTLVVFAEDFDRFPQPPESLYLQRSVRATGEVELYKGRPEMVIQGPEQIEILEEPAAQATTALTAAPPAVSRTTPVQPTTTPSVPAVVDWQEAGRYLGQEITVEGDVVRTYNSGKVAFLNFAQDYRGTLSVVIFASDFDRWNEPPDQVYRGQRIQVNGRVKEYQGSPEIVVEDPSQIVIMGPAEVEAVPPGPVVPWQEASAHEGETATVEGTVVDTYKSDKVIILSFGPGPEDFKAAIFQRNWERWPTLPDELYQGQNLRVTGQVKLYQGAPEIIVDSPAQVELVP